MPSSQAGHSKVSAQSSRLWSFFTLAMMSPHARKPSIPQPAFPTPLSQPRVHFEFVASNFRPVRASAVETREPIGPTPFVADKFFEDNASLTLFFDKSAPVFAIGLLFAPVTNTEEPPVIATATLATFEHRQLIGILAGSDRVTVDCVGRVEHLIFRRVVKPMSVVMASEAEGHSSRHLTTLRHIPTVIVARSVGVMPTGQELEVALAWD